MLNKKNNKNEGKLFIVSAASGAGKTSIINEVIKRLKNKFDISKVITYTTRPPRNNEVNEKDYFFISKQKFDQLKNNDFFLETTKYDGQLYATPKNITTNLKLGKSLIIVTDLTGAKEIKKLFRNAVLIWINPPNIEELKRRLLKRQSCTHKQIEERLKLAEFEIKEIQKTRLFDFIVINDVFDQAIKEIILIIKNNLIK